jgi:hypothetical protein
MKYCILVKRPFMLLYINVQTLWYSNQYKIGNIIKHYMTSSWKGSIQYCRRVLQSLKFRSALGNADLQSAMCWFRLANFAILLSNTSQHFKLTIFFHERILHIRIFNHDILIIRFWLLPCVVKIRFASIKCNPHSVNIEVSLLKGDTWNFEK